MKRYLLLLALLGIYHASFGQVAKGAGVFYFSAEPTLALNLCYDSEIGIDSSTGLWWEYSRDLGVWIPAGFRIQKFSGCTAPTATPLDKQSEILLNDCDSLYRWRAGAWHLINGGVVAGAGTDLSYTGSSSPVTINSSTGADITVTAGTGISLSATSGNMTIINTAPDQTVTITNGGGIVVSGSYPNFTLTAVDSSATNESFTISDGTNSENMGGQTLIVSGAGINVAVYNPATNTLTITGTEVDGSTTNELQTYAHSGTTSYTNTLSNSGGSFTLQSGGIVTISHTTGTVTISATEVDGSVTNELQTLANTSDATSHTVTLSNSGGSVQLVEGSGIALTTTGTSGAGIVTIANSGDLSATNEAWTIDGDDADTEVISNQTVKFQGAGITTTDYNPATDVLLITSTEVDGSTSNELQTYAHSGTTTYTNTLSNGGGSFSITGAGINVVSQTAGAVTITATEVDGSITNEGLLGVGAGGASSSVITSNTSGAVGVTINVAGILAITESTSANGGSITLTATEVDGSVTNEAWTIDADDVDTEVISNQTVKFQGAGITTTDYNPTTDVLLITSTEVDGSTSNELQTYSHSGTTSYTNTLSNSGGSFTLQSGGIVTISHTTGTVTISAIEVDGSTTNELQTLANTSNATTHTATLSNSGGSLQLVEGTGITLTTTGTSLDGIVTIAATAAGTDLTFTGASSPVTLNSSTGTDVTITGGGIITLSATSGNITISATEVDGSTTNELQTYAHSGTTTYTNTLSNGGGSFTLQSGGIVSISHTAGTVTISATEVDGSVTNELQTLANTSDATSHTVTLSNSGGSVQLVEGSGITLTTTGTSGAGIVTIANSGDLSATNEAWTIDADDTDTEVISNQTVKFQGAGITVTDYNPATDVLLITSTEVDGSVTNEGSLSVSAGGANDSNINSNTSGSSTIVVSGGSGISVSESGNTITISATGGSANYQLLRDDGVDMVPQPAANFVSTSDISFTLTNDGANTETEVSADIPLNAVNYSEIQQVSANRLLGNPTGSTADVSEITLASGLSFVAGALTPADASASNELQTYAHSGTTSYTNTLSNSGGSFTLQSGGIVTISHTTGTVTISATEVDGSTTNELQTLANTSNATTHTATLSNGGGSLQLVEGTGITLTTTGTSLDGIVTIAATAVGTDLTFTGTSSPVTLNSSTGTDVTITAGGIITLSATSGNITISATEVDGSTTNELQTYAHSGTTSYTNTLSNGGGSFTLQSGGIVTLSHSAGTTTISATEVDGSVTNEAWTIDGDDADTEVISNQTVKFQGAGITTTDYNPATDVLLITSTEVDGSTTNEVLTISDGTNSEALGGQTLTVAGAGINVASYSIATNTLTITGTEVDGSITNEGLLGVGAGGASSSVITSNTSGAVGVTINAAGILAISESTSANGGSITLTATEVDGSTSNELQTYAHSGTTSYTNTLSNSGGSFTLQSGGIVSISHSTGTVTISATEVDGSTTNELQTLANTSNATTHTATLSNSGGSLQLVEGTGITLTTTGTSLDGIVTIAATAAGTDLTFSGASSPVTLNSSTGTDVTITAGGIVTLSATSGNITISATEVDGSTTNEVLTISDGINSEALGGQTLTVSGAGINVASYSIATNTLTITGTEVDGSVTNEGLLGVGAGGASSSVITSNTSGATGVTINAAGILAITESTSANGGSITLTATEVDGSTSNELQTYAHSGTTTYTNTLSNGGGSFSITGAGINVVSQTGGAVTITATEVDGSVTNELQTIANTSDATSHTVTLSNSGGSVQLVEGSGITLTTTGTSGAGIVTIASTATDQNGIYGEGGVAGSGDGTLPPGGSTVTIPGQWQPLQFNTSATTGEIETAIRVVSSQPNSDVQWTKYLVGKTPSDSLEIMAYDGGTYIQETGGQLIITTDQQMYLIADSIQASNVPSKTTIPNIFGSTSTGWLQKINGTTTGQYLTWNQTSGYWELSAAPGGGNVSGTGANGRSTFWTGTSTVSGDDAYWWDNTNKRLGLGTAAGTPSAQLESRTNSLGTTQTTTAGLGLTNTTAAAVNAQQISPALRWSGNGWKTNATAGSQAVEFRAYVTPVQGAANPSGYLGFGSAINGTWTNDRINFNSGGEVGIGTTTFTGSGAFAKLNVYGGNATDFTPYVFNGFATSQSGGVVYGQISNLLTTATTVLSFNEVADINSIKAGIRRYGSTHATRANELEIFNQQSAPITLQTNGSTRYTMNNAGVAFQPGAFGAGQSSAATVTSTLTTTSFETAYLETVGAPTFDATVHTVIYTASTNISWTLPTAAACACEGRQYILHHAGTAGTVTLSQTITKGNAGNFNTLTAGQWAYIIYGSSTIRGYKVTSL